MNLQSPNILYEDSHLIVCVKPAGIPTQSKSIQTPDMVSILKNYIAKSNPSPKTPEPYLAVIHRLDQPVRGIMVFAKTPFAARALNRELQAEGFGKHYRAAVLAKPPEDSGTLENYMVKDGRSNTSRICTEDTAGARLAKLSYRTVSDSQRFFPLTAAAAELDVHLFTGRHHQIRVQLSHIGCPIVGDAKYGPGPQAGSGGRPALLLCSYRLEFTHPKTKKRLTFCLESDNNTT